MKLRLLVTLDCNKSCPKCSNLNNLKSILPVEHYNYSEIMITGGEPLLDYTNTMKIIREIKLVSDAKIYLYTSEIKYDIFMMVLKHIDGVTLSLQTIDDTRNFITFMSMIKDFSLIKNKSLRLKIFKESFGNDDKLILHAGMQGWKVEVVDWLDDCPIPQNEDFKYHSNLINKFKQL